MSDKFFGLYRGTVIDNKDPLGQMRITAFIPDVLGEIKSSWALPCVPPGVKLIPTIGTKIWIEFEAGDPSRPVWIGTTGDPGVSIGDVKKNISGVSTSITVATRKNISRRKAISAIEAVGIDASRSFFFLIMSQVLFVSIKVTDLHLTYNKLLLYFVQCVN